eukprot:6209252-Pleurochrysis_carterae.AAC.2
MPMVTALRCKRPCPISTLLYELKAPEWRRVQLSSFCTAQDAERVPFVRCQFHVGMELVSRISASRRLTRVPITP